MISVMLAVPDAQAAAAWYERALGAERTWDLGSVIGLHINGAPFFLGEPSNAKWTARTRPRTLLRSRTMNRSASKA